jgi:GT2 family glycosyltransferase
MKIVVIIPSYNRFDRLWHTLKSLQNQTFKNFEAVIVDDGSDADIHEFIKKNCSFIGFKLKIIKQKNSGASVALNTGLQTFSDGLFFLTDDDIILLPDTLEKHLEFHYKYPNAILCGSARMDKSAIISPLYEYKFYMEQCWENEIRKFIPPLKVSTNAFFVTTANTSFPCEVIEKIGGFNPELRDGYDVEFCLRALKNGVDVYFDYRIKTIHNDVFSLRHYALRQKAYINSKLKIAKLMPEFKELLFKNYQTYIPWYKKFIYKLLKNEKINNFIEESPFFSKFPKFFRYKIYGISIAALSSEN